MNNLYSDHEKTSILNGGAIRSREDSSMKSPTNFRTIGSTNPTIDSLKKLSADQNHLSIMQRGYSERLVIKTLSSNLRLIKAKRLRMRNHGSTPLISIF